MWVRDSLGKKMRCHINREIAADKVVGKWAKRAWWKFNELYLQHKTKYKRSQIACTIIFCAISLTLPGNKLLQHVVYSLIGSPGTWRCWQDFEGISAQISVEIRVSPSIACGEWEGITFSKDFIRWNLNFVFVLWHLICSNIWNLTEWRIIHQFRGFRSTLKGGPEPLEKESHEFLGSKRDDRFSNPFFEMVPKTCQGSFFVPALAW